MKCSPERFKTGQINVRLENTQQKLLPADLSVALPRKCTLVTILLCRFHPRSYPYKTACDKSPWKGVAFHSLMSSPLWCRSLSLFNYS